MAVSCRACCVVALLVLLARSSGASIAPLKLIVSPSTVVAAIGAPANSTAAQLVDLELTVQNGDLPRGLDADYRLITAPFASINASCSVRSSSSVLCACAFSSVGAHAVTLVEGGDELGVALVVAFEQPAAEHLSRSVFSLSGHDEFVIRLQAQELPVKSGPCARFEVAGAIFDVPVDIEQRGSVSLVGRSPEFPGARTISAIKMFYSLNCVQFTQVFPEDHADISAKPEKPYRIGFIYNDQLKFENGWIYQQNVARMNLNVAFGKSIESLCVESQPDIGPNVCGDHCDGPDGWCTQMPGCAGKGLSHSCYMEGKRLIEQESVDMIIGVTFWYWPDLVQLATEYPGKRFLSTAPGSPAHLSSNFARAWIRRYQLTYMSGFVLGQHPDVRANPRVGYVCSFSGACKIAIGAFAKGLYEASGLQFSIFVTYTRSWGNARRERIAAERFFKYYKVSAVSTICDTLETYRVAAEHGGFSIGYATDVLPSVGPSLLTGFLLSWQELVQRYVGSAMANASWGASGEGSSTPLYTWAGLDAGGWTMTALSPELPSEARRPIVERMAEFAAGHDDIWCGTLRRPDGTVVETPILGSSPQVGPGECMGENPRVRFNAGWQYMAIKDACTGEDEKHHGFCYLGDMNVTHDVPDVCHPGSALATEGCLQCAAGLISKSGEACVHCPEGTVASADALDCLSCPNGATTIQEFPSQGLGMPMAPSVHLRQVMGVEACELACKVDERCDGFFLHESGSCWTLDLVDMAALSEAGTYKFYKREPIAQCSFCPGDADYVFLPGQRPLCVCPKQTYQAPGTDALQCRPCRRGMHCPGEGAIRLQPGYFASTSDPESVFQCFSTAERCPGGEPGSCAVGRLNTTVACTRCAPGHRPSVSGPCVSCSSSDMLPIISMIGIAVVMLAILHHRIESRDRISENRRVIVIGLMFGQMVTVMQQMGIISMIPIDWREPLAGLFKFFGLFTFNIEALHLDCYANPGPAAVLLFKALMVIGFVLLQLGIHVVRACHMKRSIMDKLSSVICIIGSIFIVFLISLVSCLLASFQCQRHPNGVLTVVAYPSVACWTQEYDSPHMGMVVISSVASLIPLTCLCLCLYVLYRLPSDVARGNTECLDRYSFLVFRFRPGAFNFAFCAILRQTLVAAIPIVTEALAQIGSMMVIQLLYLAAVVRVLPWRVQVANAVDICSSLCMVLLVFLAGLCVEDVDSQSIAVVMIVAIVAMLALILAAMLLGIYTSLCYRRDKTFRFFLCHHKAGAGNFARILKLRLTSAHKGRAFLDSDDLSDLTGLFDRVAEEAANLVVLGSAEIWTRPWCMGELVAAKAHSVQVCLILLPDGTTPSNSLINGYEAKVPGVQALFEHGMSVAMVQDALRWVCTCTCIKVNAPICNALLDLVVKHLGSPSSVGSVELKAHPHAAEAVAPGVTTVVIADCRELEPVSLALVVKQLLSADLVASGAATVPCILWPGTELPASARNLLVICTHGVFHCEEVLGTLARAAVRDVYALPIICQEHFRFPTQAFFEELKGIIQHVVTPLPSEKLLLVVRGIFTEIAVTLSCTDSEAILKARVTAVVTRLTTSRRSLSGRTRNFDSECSKQSFEESAN